MGLFDKMFGRGASASMSQPNAQGRFDELKRKYAPVLQAIESEDVRLRNLHIENGKLVVRGDARTQQVKDRVWDEIKRVDPGYSDLVADIRVAPASGGTYGTSTGARATGAGTGDAEGAGRGGGYAQPRTPDLDRPTPTSLAHEQTYTVKAGDTLSKISQQFYGDADEYMRIFYANREVLHDPNRIQVGQKLVIPPDND